MWSIIARTAFCELTNRSGPTPVVPYQAPWSTFEVSEPGAVRNCGAGSARPFSSREAQRHVHRRLQPGHADLAVALAAVRVAGREQRAVDLDRQVQRGPAHELARVHVPAEAAGRHDRRRGPGRRADAHRPHERRQRDRDLVAEARVVARGDVEDLQVRVGEVVGQQPEPGQDRGPAPAARLDVEDLHHERVAGRGALDRDRAGERIHAVPVEPVDHARRRSRGRSGCR